MLALLLLAQQVERDVAKPFEHCMQIGRSVCAYGDWDRDGHADFLIAAPQKNADSTPTVALVSGADGRGLLVLRADKGFGDGLGTCSDLDGDKRPEILAQVSDGKRSSQLVLSSRDGRRLLELGAIQPTEVDDLDGDGRRDWIGCAKTLGKLDVLSGKTGAWRRVWADGFHHDAEAVLLERKDGGNELALAAPAWDHDTLRAVVDVVPLVDAKPRVTRAIELGRVQATSWRTHVRAAGDLDGDGFGELVLASFEDEAGPFMSDPTWPHGDVRVLSGKDLSALHELTSPGKVARFGYAIDAGADVNGDGAPDVLVTEYGDPSVEGTRFGVWLFSGRDGKPLREEHGLRGFGCSACFVGDVDGDGTPDYAISTLDVENPKATEPGTVELFSGKNGASLREWTR